MEGLSPELALMAPHSSEGVSANILRLATAADDLVAVAAAARVLLR